MATEKTITGWLVVDWKTESHRTRKSKPDATDLGANELLAEVSIDVTVPEVEVPTLALEIDVPEAQVQAATLDALDAEQMPDWTDTAAGIVADHEERVRAAESRQELREVVDSLTAKVLLDVNTRPDPEQVQQFVTDIIHEETVHSDVDVADAPAE